MSKVKAVPEGYHSVTPYLSIDGAAQAIQFYQKAFGAKELLRMPAPNGRIGHAELRIGDSIIMLADEEPSMGSFGPKSVGGTPVTLMIYLENVDEVFDQAVIAGAKVLKPLKDQFYGDRSANLEDPFGHKWIISTHIEDVSPAEMDKRMKALMEQKEPEPVLD
jgi:PhnB protein